MSHMLDRSWVTVETKGYSGPVWTLDVGYRGPTMKPVLGEGLVTHESWDELHVGPPPGCHGWQLKVPRGPLRSDSGLPKLKIRSLQ